MASTHFKRNVIRVIGHRNPDTDSICSAIAYAWLKSQLEPETEYVACRAGEINRETEFVLKHFGQKKPPLCDSVKPHIWDIDIRLQPGIRPEISVRTAWVTMQKEEIDTLCITSPDNNLLGLITVKDIANANMEIMDENLLAKAHTPYCNIVRTLDGVLLVGDPNAIFCGKRVFVGSLSSMQQSLKPGDLVLIPSKYEDPMFAIEHGAALVVMCRNTPISQDTLDAAREKGCSIITTAYDPYACARLLDMAVPVGYLMKKENLLTFNVGTLIEDAQKVMGGVRFRYFPVLDERGKYFGMVSRRNMLNLRRQKIILVDHNEVSQAVEGIEEQEVTEIIDHHRIGSLETSAPAYFRNVPVGCTSTILYDIFRENDITPPPYIAGLMLSAILSDTLMFRSPTCTPMDQAAARQLAVLAKKNIQEYAEQMFTAADNLEGRTAEDLLQSDLKVFDFGSHRVGVGQCCFVTRKSFYQAEEMISKAIEDMRIQNGLSQLCQMITFTPDSSTLLLYCGKDMDQYLTRAFGKVPSDGKLLLPGVVSRKKQFVPPLYSVMQD